MELESKILLVIYLLRNTGLSCSNIAVLADISPELSLSICNGYCWTHLTGATPGINRDDWLMFDACSSETKVSDSIIFF